MSEQTPTPEQIDTLRSVIPYKIPYCSGTRDVPAASCFLFYEKDGSSHRLNLLNATPVELAHLQNSCDPATFGLNDKDVLDESVRKAGKLDLSRFSATFDVAGSRILNLVQADLLEGRDGNRLIIAELYKLNVYGEGSFFKEHKDTPRGKDMFGSLVVVLPTSHEGGALILRQDKREWIFDSGKEMATRPQEPFVSYIAFYGDVDHEVSPVLSGHRITLTYNLYFGDSEPIVPHTNADEEKLRITLSRLLADPLFLPEGGRLGFGLHHLYPVKSHRTVTGNEKVTDLPSFLTRLKGSDAIIARACASLSLRVSVNAIYELENYGEVMCASLIYFDHEPSESMADMNEEEQEYELLESLAESKGVLVSEYPVSSDRRRYKRRRLEAPTELMPFKPVSWITQITPLHATNRDYAQVLGNESVLTEPYGNICLVVEIGDWEARTKVNSS